MVKKIVLLLLVFCLAINFSWGETPKIRIIGVKGDEAEVDLNGSGEFEDAEKGMILGTNGKVITGFGTQVKIDFAKRGLVTVKELTNYSVGEFLITDEGITAHTNMKVGEVNVKVDRKYKAIDFTVSSPTCTASVRGSSMDFAAHGPKKNRAVYRAGKISFRRKKSGKEFKLDGSVPGSSISNFGEWEPVNPVYIEKIFQVLPPPPDGWTPEEQQQLITTVTPTGYLPPQDIHTLDTRIDTVQSINVGDGSVRLEGNISGSYTGLDNTGTVHVSW